MNLKERIRENQKRNGISPITKNTPNTNKNFKRNKKPQNAYTFMAWGKVEDSTDSTFKLYKGVTPVEIIAFNPTGKQLEEIYGRPQTNEPVYTGTRKFGDREVNYADCVFYLRSIKDICGFEKIYRLRLQILNTFFTNKENTKFRVVDAYNRTAWIEKELYKSRGIPMYANGPAQIDAATYTPLYRGVEELNKFLRAYRGVASVTVYDPETNGQKVNPDLASAMGVIEHPENFFKGDFNELLAFLKDTQDHATANGTVQKVKVCIGVRTGNDGRLYQDVYPEEFEKYRSRVQRATGLYRNIAYALKDSEVNGRHANTEYYAGELMEYTPTPTQFQPKSAPTPELNGFTPVEVANNFPGTPIAAEDKFPWE